MKLPKRDAILVALTGEAVWGENVEKLNSKLKINREGDTKSIQLADKDRIFNSAKDRNITQDQETAKHLKSSFWSQIAQSDSSQLVCMHNLTRRPGFEVVKIDQKGVELPLPIHWCQGVPGHHCANSLCINMPMVHY